MPRPRPLTKRQQDLARAKKRIQQKSHILDLVDQQAKLKARIKSERDKLKTI